MQLAAHIALTVYVMRTNPLIISQYRSASTLQSEVLMGGPTINEASFGWFQDSAVELPVNGEIPSWLEGDFVRNGPGAQAPFSFSGIRMQTAEVA